MSEIGGFLLKDCREKRGLTQKDFALDYLGISPQYLCDIEKGRRMPSRHTIKKLAPQMDKDYSYLCCLFGKSPEWISFVPEKVFIKYYYKMINHKKTLESFDRLRSGKDN